MKIRAWTKLFFAVLMALTFAGCATQKVDWQSRIGNYTYDQAVRDYGPPDKSAALSNGTKVDDWLIRPGRNIATPQPYLMPPGGFGAPSPIQNSTYVPGYYMQLVFTPDGKLKSCQKFSR